MAVADAGLDGPPAAGAIGPVPCAPAGSRDMYTSTGRAPTGRDPREPDPPDRSPAPDSNATLLNELEPHKTTLASPSAQPIHVPRASFTAQMLLQAPMESISEQTTTIAIGPPPDAWLGLLDSVLLLPTGPSRRLALRNWLHKTRRGVQTNMAYFARTGRGLLARLGLLNGGIAETILDAGKLEWDPRGDMRGDLGREFLDFGFAQDKASVLHTVGSSHLSDSEFLSDDSGSEQDSDEFSKVLYGVLAGRSRQNSASKSNDYADKDAALSEVSTASLGTSQYSSAVSQLGPELPPEYNIDQALRRRTAARNKDGLPPEPTIQELPRPASVAEPDPSSLGPTSSVGSCLSVDLVDLQHFAGAPVPAELPHPARTITFADQNKQPRRRMAYMAPEPEPEAAEAALRLELVVAEKRRRHRARKLHLLAVRSTGRALQSGLRLKVRVKESVLRRLRTGDIVRTDKMLVMVQKPGRHGDDGAAVRVSDHWREYYVVLRKTASAQAPLEGQLYEAHRGARFEGKPDHSFLVLPFLQAGFCSTCDKTIRLAEPPGMGGRVFTMNARYPSVAFAWLFMVGLDEQLTSALRVKLPGTATEFRVVLPPDLVRRSLVRAPLVTVHLLPEGYHAEHDELLQYLRETVQLKLALAVPPPHGAGAFCFKFYDRLEWASHDAGLFFLQTQLLAGDALLQFRQRASSSAPPCPVEGFLARITDIGGSEYAHLRAIYKALYFSSSRNLLFFLKFARGLPPSPQNVLLQDDCDRRAVCRLLPPVYTHTPFALDGNGHLPWLAADFAQHDHWAIEETARRLQLVVGAQGMLDLCSVVAVEPIPKDAVPLLHLYFQSYFWHSSPRILDDDSLLDCSFVLTMDDGSRLKLMAPSQAARNEWVLRLRALADYWRAHRARRLEAMIATKLQNKARLWARDLVDLNADFDPRGVEIEHSVANSELYLSPALPVGVLCAGPLYQKQKKHASFSQYYVVLCPGYLVVFTLYRRSRVSGRWKKTAFFERYLTIPLSECYVYSGEATQLDLVAALEMPVSGDSDTPRLYPDGWRSSEDEYKRCFSIWFGGKRRLRRGLSDGASGPRNPGLVHMVRKLGLTGKVLVFLARSRQETEMWVSHLLNEVDRFASA